MTTHKEPLILVSFFLDCGRMGDLDGLFLTTREELEESYGKTAGFDEELGKHSYIDVVLDETYFTIESEEGSFISEFVRVLGRDFLSGVNPLEVIEEE